MNFLSFMFGNVLASPSRSCAPSVASVPMTGADWAVLVLVIAIPGFLFGYLFARMLKIIRGKC